MMSYGLKARTFSVHSDSLRCSIDNCKTKPINGKQIYPIPNGPTRCLWVDVIKRHNQNNLSLTDFVCSDHFSDDQKLPNGHLKGNSVPNIFPSSLAETKTTLMKCRFCEKVFHSWKELLSHDKMAAGSSVPVERAKTAAERTRAYRERCRNALSKTAVSLLVPSARALIQAAGSSLPVNRAKTSAERQRALRQRRRNALSKATVSLLWPSTRANIQAASAAQPGVRGKTSTERSRAFRARRRNVSSETAVSMIWPSTRTTIQKHEKELGEMRIKVQLTSPQVPKETSACKECVELEQIRLSLRQTKTIFRSALEQLKALREDDPAPIKLEIDIKNLLPMEIDDL